MSFRSTQTLETRLYSAWQLSATNTSRNWSWLLLRPQTRSLLPNGYPFRGQTFRFSDFAGRQDVAVDDSRTSLVSQPTYTSFVDRSHLDPKIRIETGYLDVSHPEYQFARYHRWKLAFKHLFHGTDESRAEAESTVERTEQRASALKFVSQRTPEQIKEQYEAMSERLRTELLPDIIVGCLLIGARLSLRLLEALPEVTEDFTIRMDCLLKLRRDPKLWSEMEKDTSVDGLKAKFYKELDKLWEHEHLPRFRFNSSYAGLLLGEATSVRQGSRLLERYLSTYSDRKSDVLLIFVDFFIQWGNEEQALHALRHINPDQLQASDTQLLQRCTNLLELDTIDTHAESRNFKILPQLLELGIKPDPIIHTVIIQNAIKAGVHRVAWDLYEYLLTENLPTVAAMHLILMKDAFGRQDVAGLNKILSAIHQRADLYNNPYLIGCTMNIIRIIYAYEKRANPTETFSHVLGVYTRAWKPDIYITLGMISPSDVSIPKNTALTDPPPEALAWAIFQYCLTQTQYSKVDRLWTNLQRALSSSNPSANPALATAAATRETLYGGFIIFYSRNPRSIGKCVDIVSHMLEHAPTGRCCAPTGRTWLRLMCSYLRQGQHGEAEKIRRMMLKKGIRPRGKEFAYLLDHWPGTEVAERARRAISELGGSRRFGIGGGKWEDGPKRETGGDEDEPLREELFEGVALPGAVNESLRIPRQQQQTDDWKGMVDFRAQSRAVAKQGDNDDDDREMLAQLRKGATAATRDA